MDHIQPESDGAVGGTSRPCRLVARGGSCMLCFALSLITIILLLSIIFKGLEIPHGFQSTSLRGLILEVLSLIILPTIVFLGEIIKSLFPWPVIAVAALLLIGWGPDRVRELLSSSKFELPGFKFEGGATSALKREMGDAQKVVASAKGTMRLRRDSCSLRSVASLSR